MLISVHNPDQYMASLRQIIAQGRKRIGLLVGAGGPAGTPDPNTGESLMPDVAGLTTDVLNTLDPKYSTALQAVRVDLPQSNIESILTRVRSLAAIIGSAPVHGLDALGYQTLGEAICAKIAEVVSKPLPMGRTPYSDLVNWISGTERSFAVEIFTTNYDLLFEQAMERAKMAYFDGFVGGREPFFDSAAVANDDLPVRWTRLWKLHGSLGWTANERGDTIRVGQRCATHLIFPEHLKYEQTQKAPYSALFDRLRWFLMQPDTLLLVIGFSFADAHISARIDECLAANPSASVFAFQYRSLDDEHAACEVAGRRPNMSVYAPDRAMINGIRAVWQPGDPPTRDWEPIRASYWGDRIDGEPPVFLLGTFEHFANFFASSRSDQFSSSAPLQLAAASEW